MEVLMSESEEEISSNECLTIEGFERFAERVLEEIRETVNVLGGITPEAYVFTVKNPDTGQREDDLMELIIDCEDNAFGTSEDREKFTLSMTELCKEAWGVASLVIFEGWHSTEDPASAMAVPQVMTISENGSLKIKEQEIPLNADSAIVCLLEHIGYPGSKSKVWVCKLSRNKAGEIIVGDSDKRFGYSVLEGSLTNLLNKEVKAQA
jgi:hypothetical protein